MIVNWIRPIGQINLSLRVLKGELAIVRLAPQTAIPRWVSFLSKPLVSVTSTAQELSIVDPAAAGPDEVQCESGWRALRVEGTLDFVLTRILGPFFSPLPQPESASSHHPHSIRTTFPLAASRFRPQSARSAGIFPSPTQSQRELRTAKRDNSARHPSFGTPTYRAAAA